MNRVVLDTNIIVSALLVPAGTQASVLLLALREPNALYVSQPVLAEYDEVLRRPRLKLQPRQIDEALAAIRKVARLVAPTQTLSVSADESDNRFLECAEAAEAVISSPATPAIFRTSTKRRRSSPDASSWICSPDQRSRESYSP